MSELVSILIPAYNAERWILDTIKSAMNQSWSNKEIIVVDDGSKDSTFDIAKTFESKNIKVVRQINTGACGARNHALRLAQGDYIQWLDADDLLHPDKISKQLSQVGPGRTSRTLLTCAWGKFFFRHETAKFVPDSLWQDRSAVDWILTKFKDNVWMNPSVWLVSRQLTELAGLWDERLSSSGDDDGEYICRVVANASNVKFVAEAQCYYRIGTVGSLNWNMEKSEKSLDLLALAMALNIAHLRSLEDSPRTRDAAMRYLQTFLPYFYSANEELLNKINALAESLGGKLNPPTLGWKYRPFELALGPLGAKRVMNNWRSMKLLAHGRWDKFLFKLDELSTIAK